MAAVANFDTSTFEESARAVAEVLRTLSNERRLMILCKLVERGEASVTTLGADVGLSQSALSQHLAKMRDQNLVTFRRQGQTLWYRVCDGRVERLLSTLHELYCSDDAVEQRKGDHP